MYPWDKLSLFHHLLQKSKHFTIFKNQANTKKDTNAGIRNKKKAIKHIEIKQHNNNFSLSVITLNINGLNYPNTVLSLRFRSIDTNWLKVKGHSTQITAKRGEVVILISESRFYIKVFMRLYKF